MANEKIKAKQHLENAINALTLAQEEMVLSMRLLNELERQQTAINFIFGIGNKIVGIENNLVTFVKKLDDQ